MNFVNNITNLGRPLLRLTTKKVMLSSWSRFGQDINDFSASVSQYSCVFPDQSEWQTLRTNLKLILLDIHSLHDEGTEQSHHGRPTIVSSEQTGRPGRPCTVINRDFLSWAYTQRTTSGISQFLGLSCNTVRQSLLDYGLAPSGANPFPSNTNDAEVEGDILNPAPSNAHTQEELPAEVRNVASSIASSSGYLSNISDEDLDRLVRELHPHYPRAGIQILDGMLRNLGHILPRERIQQSLIQVDPVHQVFERIRIRRRRYNVPGPNSLWHHDGHHHEFSEPFD
ncbi:hypothetical protein BT96DRAFT_1003909 [Gymnopus androsaceus JB14]|uniref:Uncharacterized protein n=1 Tax=Gymnopus androsaceus JB14 TaxID=1447944 RepID=A0A6A4GSK4_9AGAR|nr:hypothetical protein BT96DRAFT_1003909 [Gymnopus androsaceus JB14]